MMNNYSFYSMFGSTTPIIYFLMLADLILKGVTLYKSARKDQKVWFVALLLVNSLGLLPIMYLIVNKDLQIGEAATISQKTVVKKTKKSKR